MCIYYVSVILFWNMLINLLSVLSIYEIQNVFIQLSKLLKQVQRRTYSRYLILKRYNHLGNISQSIQTSILPFTLWLYQDFRHFFPHFRISTRYITPSSPTHFKVFLREGIKAGKGGLGFQEGENAENKGGEDGERVDISGSGAGETGVIVVIIISNSYPPPPRCPNFLFLSLRLIFSI